ncbi:MAG: acyltransferase [Ferruginibacter sp.]|nr:acyltransferase [Chitinophagaceae bacterium]
MSSSSKYYFPQLDAIRGLSFLAVYFVHAYHPDFGTGFFLELLQYLYNNLALSIDVFFILSSFLLTWLGINEYKVKGNFSFGNYFIRRALRIWPLYILLMIFSFIVVPYAADYFQVPVTLPPAYYYLFFISNFYLEGHVYFLRFLWTLSVEEQFYLLWGVCLLLFQKRMMLCVIVLAAVSIAYTLYAAQTNGDGYYNTLIYLFDFAVGILAALLLHKESYVVAAFKKMTTVKNILFLLLLPLLFLMMFCINYFSADFLSIWSDILMRYIFIMYTGLFIIDQMVNDKTVLKLNKQRFLIYTGKISYGLYCFHGIVLTFGLVFLQRFEIDTPAVVRTVVFLIANYIIAAISYQFVEKPFLKLKNRLRRI